MKHRLIILAWALIISLSVGAWSQRNSLTTYSVSENSRLRVEGTSTIHAWTCEAHSVSGTVEVESNLDTSPKIVSTQIVIPVADLDCDNATMNKKMLKALGSETSPNILFELDDAVVSTDQAGNPTHVDVDGWLMIAGRTRPIELTEISISRAFEGLEFSGSVKLLMSDFGVKPPTALLGTIKTGDQVEIHFNLLVSEEKESS
ncbi:MAG: YceI family protein [Bacteroidetes bacterium]|nr:YceI family protein [Bacteroidota bacterium]